MNKVNKEDMKSFITEKTTPYLNKTVSELKILLSISSKSKNINSMIISKIFDLPKMKSEIVLDIKNNYAFKTVTLSEKNKVTESMSFPAIDYFDMVKNDWLNSSVYKYFSAKTIVLFVFKKNEDDIIFNNIVYLDLTNDELNNIFLIWEKVKNMIINNSMSIGGKNGFSIVNFPKKDENDIVHIRPHDTNSNSGKVLLPNGNRIMNYCFWLNNTFIENKILKEKQYEAIR